MPPSRTRPYGVSCFWVSSSRAHCALARKRDSFSSAKTLTLSAVSAVRDTRLHARDAYPCPRIGAHRRARGGRCFLLRRCGKGALRHRAVARRDELSSSSSKFWSNSGTSPGLRSGIVILRRQPAVITAMTVQLSRGVQRFARMQAVDPTHDPSTRAPLVSAARTQWRAALTTHFFFTAHSCPSRRQRPSSHP